MDNECNITLDRVFLYKNFTKTFINKEYKIHRENTLFELSKPYFDNNQSEIDNKILLEDMLDNIEHVSVLRKRLSIITITLNKIKKNYEIPRGKYNCILKNCKKKTGKYLLCPHPAHTKEYYVQYQQSADLCYIYYYAHINKLDSFIEQNKLETFSNQNITDRTINDSENDISDNDSENDISDNDSEEDNNDIEGNTTVNSQLVELTKCSLIDSSRLDDIDYVLSIRKMKYPEENVEIDSKYFNIDAVKRLYPYLLLNIAQKMIYEIIQDHFDYMDKLWDHYYEIKDGHKSNKKFIPCSNMDCNSMVSPDQKCNACSSITCSLCRERKDTKDDKDGKNHQCDKNILDSVKTIKKDSKSCPICSFHISKIDGCDNMYCINCRTFFNWITLKIINKVHNPEYTDHMNRIIRNTRTVGDILCGRELDDDFIQLIKIKVNKYNFQKHRFRKNLSEEFIHLYQQYENDIIKLYNFVCNLDRIQNSTNYNFREQNYMIFDSDLIKKFISNEITESKFKESLQRREKHLEKCNNFYLILTTFLGSVVEILYRLDTDYKSFQEKNIDDNIKTCSMLADISKEIYTLIDITNLELNILSATYNSYGDGTSIVLNNWF
ncbi:MAG: BRcat and Rcat domain-containing protein [Cetobacterium sp.]